MLEVMHLPVVFLTALNLMGDMEGVAREAGSRRHCLLSRVKSPTPNSEALRSYLIASALYARALRLA